MLLLLAAACSDNGLHALKDEVVEPIPTISVTPDRLDFWSVGTEEVAVQSFTVWSTGDALLQVDSITVDGAASFSLLTEETAFDLEPGASRDLEVAFAPIEPGESAADVVVVSDDPDRPEVRVPLTGEGEVPSLVITPDDWDFGQLALGCVDELELALQNVGSATLEVESWTYTGEGYTFTPALDPPFELAPWEVTTATVTFSPAAAGTLDATLSVVSNDPRGVVTADQSGEGADGDEVVDSFDTDTDPPVDVLFAVDQSTSMDDDAAGLGAAFQTFIDTLATVTSGWQLGVVTTDDGCVNGGILDAGTTSLASTFADAVAYGEDRDILYDEALFQVVDAALSETVAGGCNEGLLRDGAPLHVIVLSDEPERSTEVASAWTWDWYLDRWQGYVDGDSLLTVSGVVDADDCNEGDAGYAEAIAATGGEHLSICSGDWADRLVTLGMAALTYAWTFELSETPVEASIVVSVDGTEWTTGWTYDASLNAVVLEGLTAGSSVEVRYQIAQACGQ